MSLLQATELFIALFIVATAEWGYDRWRDHNDRHHIGVLISMDHAVDELAVQAEEIRNLPEREPWQRWA